MTLSVSTKLRTQQLLPNNLEVIWVIFVSRGSKSWEDEMVRLGPKQYEQLTLVSV